MSNKTLYIIGNGFDLYHGLKTSYADFCRYVKENDKELYEFLDWDEGGYLELNRNKKGLWSDFENDLGTFDHGRFYNDHDNTDPSHEKYHPSDLYVVADVLKEESEGMIEKLQQALYGWLNNINYRRVRKKLSLDINARYLTFNYTPTLSRLYSIPNENILHIHHSLAEHGRNLIFGHGNEIVIAKEPLEFDDEGFPTNANLSSYEEAEDASKMLLIHSYKNTHDIIDRNKDFFNRLHEIDLIVVWGHSLNEIDLPYFQQLNTIIPRAKWTVSYYADSEPEKMHDALSKVGVKGDTSFIKLE